MGAEGDDFLFHLVRPALAPLDGLHHVAQLGFGMGQHLGQLAEHLSHQLFHLNQRAAHLEERELGRVEDAQLQGLEPHDFRGLFLSLRHQLFGDARQLRDEPHQKEGVGDVEEAVERRARCMGREMGSVMGSPGRNFMGKPFV